MKKLLPIALIALFAVISVVTPTFISTQFEKELTAAVEKINQTPQYKAEVTSLDSGWFGAEGTIILGVKNDALLGSDAVEQTLELTFQTTYGPFLFSDAGIMGLYAMNVMASGEQLRDIIKWDEDTPFYSLAIAESFTGTINLSDEIPSFKDLEEKLTFSGYQGEGSVSEEITYRGETSSITTNDGFETNVANNIVIQIQADISPEDLMETALYDSETLISIGELTVGEEMKIENLSLFSNTGLDQNTQLGNFDLGGSIESVNFDAYSANNISLIMTLDKISNEAFKMLDQFNQGVTLSPEETGALLNDIATKLLLEQPVYTAEFSGSIPEGDIKIASTSQLESLPSNIQIASPQFWILNAFVNANATIDKPAGKKVAQEFLATQMGAESNSPNVIKQVDAVIGNLIQQNFIVEGDEKYSTEFELKAGKTSINGKPFPLF